VEELAPPRAMAPKCQLGRPALALSGRTTGLLLIMVGTIIDSCEALIVRQMGSHLEDWHNDTRWQGDDMATHGMLIFYKYLFTICFVLVAVRGTSPSFRALWEGILEGPRHIAAAGVCQTLISMFLTLAMLETETATCYLLFLLAPLWAALFERIFLREPIRRCTALALVSAAASVVLMKLPTVFEEDDTSGVNAGDIYAVAAGASLGVMLTVGRSAALHAPKARMTCSPILGSLLCVVIAIIMLLLRGHSPLIVGGDGTVTVYFLLLAAVAGFTTAVFYVCALLAAKYITGTEVGLVEYLETVLGPLWVYIGLGEVPTHWTFIGGSLLLGTLILHALFTSSASPLDCTREERYQSGTIELRRLDTKVSPELEAAERSPSASARQSALSPNATSSTHAATAAQ
jgi:drug/metabolite transporter (DMT)-like permease|tara:strand:+ start:5553 stop:6761 length:1209 start_codon:yes stop_codon:yes gene_type:complete